MAFTLVVAAFIALALLAVLLVLSPGRPAPLLNDNGQLIANRLSEKVFVEINGIRQGLFIQSTDKSHPVLLFLHGGQGMPQFIFNMTHPSGLERHFTVAWWEQRGAGLSFDAAIPAASMTLDQLIADTIAVTDYLRERFAQDKCPINSDQSFWPVSTCSMPIAHAATR